jgi:hypothetical protein
MSSERWLRIEDDGTIILHSENDGWTFLRRGPEAVEEPLTPEKAIRDYPEKLAQALLNREADRRAKWGVQRGTST